MQRGPKVFCPWCRWKMAVQSRVCICHLGWEPSVVSEPTSAHAPWCVALDLPFSARTRSRSQPDSASAKAVLYLGREMRPEAVDANACDCSTSQSRASIRGLRTRSERAGLPVTRLIVGLIQPTDQRTLHIPSPHVLAPSSAACLGWALVERFRTKGVARGVIIATPGPPRGASG